MNTAIAHIPCGPNKVAPVPRRPARVPGLFERQLVWLASRLHGLLGVRGRSQFGILMYHRTCPRVAGIPEPTWNVEPARLAQQIAGLQRRGFVPWPLRRVLRNQQLGEPIPRNVFVVTFDDGYECVYRHAWPILERLTVPATIFLATAYLDSDEPFPSDDWLAAGDERAPPESWRPLRTEQCREMQASGLIELGAHTHTHDDFRGRPSDLAFDLEQNVDVLRSRFGVTEATFAFPFGMVRQGFAGPPLSDVARQAGLLCSLSTEPELAAAPGDPFSWGRFAAEQHDTAATLAAKLSGWVCALRGLKRALRSRLKP